MYLLLQLDFSEIYLSLQLYKKIIARMGAEEMIVYLLR
jgi:hypothetical protein